MFTPLSPPHERTWPLWLVLCLGLVLTGLATLSSYSGMVRTEQRELELIANELVTKVQTRLHAHAQLLRSGAAYIAVSYPVSRGQWQEFIAQSRVSLNLPGILGVGFSVLIPPEGLTEQELKIRAEGFPDYQVWPAGERSLYTSIIYLEPFTGRNLRAFGYDMYTEPVRRAAMEQARDQDVAALSGKVHLVQETEDDVQAGTLMYVPVYRRGAPISNVDERRVALLGWVYSPYRMRDLMQGILGDMLESKDVRLVIHDGHEVTPNTLLYDSRPEDHPASVAIATGPGVRVPVDFNGHHWTLDVSYDGSAPSPLANSRVWLVGGSGTVVTLLVAALLGAFTRTRTHAAQLAQELEARQRAEQEVQALNAGLERRVAERTAELEAEVSERTRAESRLRASEERLSYAMDATRDGIWDWHLPSGAVHYSPGYARMLGLAPEELTPDVSTWVGLLHPDEREEILARAGELLRDPGHYELEFRVRTKLGGYRWVLSRGKVVERDPVGAPVRAVGTHVDISERRAMEQEIRALNANLERRVEERTAELRTAYQDLRESEEKYRALVETTSDVIWEVDAQGRFTYLSPRFEALTGDPAEGHLGRTPFHLLPDDCLPADRERLVAALTAQAPVSALELPIRHSDGRTLVAEVGALPHVGPAGDYRGLRGIARDVTDRKAAEAELAAYREHLEALVDARTLDLVEARDSAQAANRAKSAFLANMSHEIRTPMNAILGFTHLLQGEIRESKPRERLAKIAAAGQNLLQLLSDILDLSKIEAERLDLEHASLSVAQVLNRAAGLVRGRAAEKGLKLKLAVDSRIPAALCGDAFRLEQMAANYVGNAVKFSKHGEISVGADLIEDEPEGVLLRVQVQDQGIGIAPEQQSRLFQPFVQGDDSTTREYRGGGLGLIIVKRLAALMGGEVGVSSEPGEGSTFWFTVRLGRPLAQAAAGDVPLLGRLPEDVEQDLATRHRGARILLVEDEPVNRAVTQDLLECVGLRVESVENGILALERIEQASFDLVLMDLRLPVMDGLAATRAIRARDIKADLPILALTANAFAEDRAACEAAGMNDFIAKPVDPNTLYAAVLRWLEPHSQGVRCPVAPGESA